MTRFFLLLLVALICAPAAFAQNNDYSHYEFYVGYAYERADNNAATFDKNGRAAFNGATGSKDAGPRPSGSGVTISLAWLELRASRVSRACRLTPRCPPWGTNSG